MANYNCEAYLRDAVTSILNQAFKDLELIVADDASTDASTDILRDLSLGDARLKVSFSEQNKGPAAARNRALDLARGEWIAVFDSDDLSHPTRMTELLAIAERTGADIVSDNQLVFDDAGLQSPYMLLGWSKQRSVDLPAYLTSNRLDGTQACLGRLKPIFRAELFAKSGLRYDEALQNAEDSDLVNYMLVQGASMLVVPQAWYLYRKHGQSISHRLTAAKLQSMTAAAERFQHRHAALPSEALTALAKLSRSYRIAEDFLKLITAVKAYKPARALEAMWRSPYVIVQFAQLILARLQLFRLTRQKVETGQLTGRPQVSLLTEGVVLDAADPRAAPLLRLLSAMREAGVDIHLICPSNAIFATRPWLRLQREPTLFASIAVRRSFRLGRFLITTTPRVWWAATRAVVNRYLQWNGMETSARTSQPPSELDAFWGPANQLFVAVEATGKVDAILCDTDLMTEGVPYVLHPRAPVGLIAHGALRWFSPAEHWCAEVAGVPWWGVEKPWSAGVAAGDWRAVV